jgi:hypothetical protein
VVDLFDANPYFERNVREMGPVAKVPRNGRELQLGRALGELPPVKLNKHMQRGLDLEPEAIRCFEAATGLRIAKCEIGCITHIDGKLQITPDALLEAVPVFVEIKCPWKTHDVPSEAWYLQMMAQMVATADPVTRIPRIRHAINVQYVRNAFVTLTICMVEYDAKLADRILRESASYTDELNRRRAANEGKIAAGPATGDGVEHKELRSAHAAMAMEKKRARSRSALQPRRDEGRGPARRKSVTRVRRTRRA